MSNSIPAPLSSCLPVFILQKLEATDQVQVQTFPVAEVRAHVIESLQDAVLDWRNVIVEPSLEVK
jgi:hypothetical protein